MGFVHLHFCGVKLKGTDFYIGIVQLITQK